MLQRPWNAMLQKNSQWSGCRESCVQELSFDGWTCTRLGPRTPQGGWDADHPLPSMASTTTSSQGDGVVAASGTFGTIAHEEDKGGPSQATDAAVRDRGSHSGTSPLGLLAAVGLVALPAVAATWFFCRTREEESSRDVIRHSTPAGKARPNPCNPCPQERWRGPPQQPEVPPVRASETVFDTFTSHGSRGAAMMAREAEEEPLSTFQQVQALLSGCSMGTCRISLARARQLEAMTRCTRPRSASALPLIS